MKSETETLVRLKYGTPNASPAFLNSLPHYVICKVYSKIKKASAEAMGVPVMQILDINHTADPISDRMEYIQTYLKYTSFVKQHKIISDLIIDELIGFHYER